jgi:hypothetical protein
MTGQLEGPFTGKKVLLAERIIRQVIASSDPGTPVSLFELTSDYATTRQPSRTEYGASRRPPRAATPRCSAFRIQADARRRLLAPDA